MLYLECSLGVGNFLMTFCSSPHVTKTTDFVGDLTATLPTSRVNFGSNSSFWDAGKSNDNP